MNTIFFKFLKLKIQSLLKLKKWKNTIIWSWVPDYSVLHLLILRTKRDCDVLSLKNGLIPVEICIVDR